LTRAFFTSRTHNEDKDNDTGVFVVVYKHDKKTIIASIADADSHGKYGYSNNDAQKGVHQVELNISAHWPKSQCDGFFYKVGIMARSGIFPAGSIHITINGVPAGTITSGNDRWQYDGDVTLMFDDNTVIKKTINGQDLYSRGGRLVWTNVA